MNQMELIKWITAHHEAGHAMMSVCVDAKIERVSIQPNDGCSGYVKGVPGTLDLALQFGWRLGNYKARWEIESQILVILAGPISENKLCGQPARNLAAKHPGNDMNKVKKLLSRLFDDGKTQKSYYAYVRAFAEELVERYELQIKFIAEELLKKETLTGDDLLNLLFIKFRKLNFDEVKVHA